MGLTDKLAVVALSADAVKQAAQHFDAGNHGLADTDTFKKAAALVQQPTIGFSYMDTKAIFERMYGLFRGVASINGHGAASGRLCGNREIACT